jgi:hypothetical protein
VLDHDDHFMSVEDLAESGITWHVIRQKYGQMVFVPPDGVHQVQNMVRISESSSANGNGRGTHNLNSDFSGWQEYQSSMEQSNV